MDLSNIIKPSEVDGYSFSLFCLNLCLIIDYFFLPTKMLSIRDTLEEEQTKNLSWLS